MAKLKFNNKLKPVTTRRGTMLDQIKRMKEFGDPSHLGSEYREFIDYLREFYGKPSSEFQGGMYAEDHDGGFEDFEMEDALEEYLTNPTKYNNASDFEGDSVDREFIREIITNKRSGKPIDPLGLGLGSKKKGRK